SRGFFLETYRESDFREGGIREAFVQENHSRSARAVLRGLHYQVDPKAQGKLVRVVAGEIFDVAVDIRRDSPTSGKCIVVKLSAENHRMLYIPAWCAHGFCVLTDRAEVIYKVTEEYSLEHERGIAWNDPRLGIQWPVTQPIISERDLHWPSFDGRRTD